MYHPGGFGKSGDNNNRPQPKSDPSIIRPILFLISILLTWVAFLLVGLELGLGWYAWPLGSVVLGISFFVYSLFKRLYPE